MRTRRAIAAGLAAVVLAVVAANETEPPAPEQVQPFASQAVLTSDFPQPQHCQTGYPGGASWYCEPSDPWLHVRTWIRADGLVSIEVCELAGRYHQELELNYIWTAVLDDATTMPLTTTSALWAPSEASPCLIALIDPIRPDRASSGPRGEWVPNLRIVRRLWRSLLPIIVNDATEPG